MCPPDFHVHVISMKNERFEVKVQPSESVVEVRCRISQSQGLNMTSFFLLHDGRQLEEKRALKFYNIEAGSTLEIGDIIHVFISVNPLIIITITLTVS